MSAAGEVDLAERPRTRVETAGRVAAAVALALYLATAAAVVFREPSAAAALTVPDALEYAWGAQRLVTVGRFEVLLDGRSHPSRYPPGFSLFFLAPVYGLDADSIGLGIVPVFLSSLAVFALVWRLCRRALPGAPGVGAAFLLLPVLVGDYWLYQQSREVMSDVPALLLGLVAVFAFTRVHERPGPRPFLAGGLLAAVAGSMRWTGFSLCLPFAWLLPSAPGRRGTNALALLGPVAVSAAALLAYDTAVFGHPLYTGYHYWLPPVSYALGPEHVVPNLFELVNPFLPARHERSDHGGQLLLGPAVWILVALLGRACRRRRPEVWQRTRPALLFLLLGALPVVLFHLFYPYHSARFALLAHVLALTLGGIWLAALARRLPRALWALACAACVLLAVSIRNPDPIGKDWYKPEVLREADRVMPDDACLVSAFNPMYVEFALLQGNRRCHVPLDANSPFVGWGIGRHGEPRVPALSWSAAESPERVEALLREGRRVFVETLQPHWRGRDESLDGLLARFEVVPVWERLHRDALVEIRLRDGGA